MVNGVEKPKPYRYKRALEKMAEDVRSQISLEKFQDRTGVSTAMIDRVRADSYTRLALEIQETLGIDLGVYEHKF
jgi:hypothetical protein